MTKNARRAEALSDLAAADAPLIEVERKAREAGLIAPSLELYEEWKLTPRPPGGGIKDDAGKPPLGLIPRSAQLREARILAYGEAKYGRHNWRKGMRWSRLGDAAMRHLLAWMDGEDIDPESGEPHLAHLRCCTGFLIEYAEHGLGTDDRYKGDIQ